MFRCRHLILVLIALIFCGASSYADPPELLGIIPSDSIGILFGNAIAPMGDQNGDGFNDMLVFPGKDGAYVFLGGASVNTVPFRTIDSITNPITIGEDVNGDGALEIIAWSRKRSRGAVYFGGLALDSDYDMIFGNDTLYLGLPQKVVGSVDSDGLPEVWGQSAQIPPRVLSYDYSLGSDTNHVWSITPANLTWLTDYEEWGRHLTIVDFNGDGYDDLAATLEGDVQDDIRGSVYSILRGDWF